MATDTNTIPRNHARDLKRAIERLTGRSVGVAGLTMAVRRLGVKRPSHADIAGLMDLVDLERNSRNKWSVKELQQAVADGALDPAIAEVDDLVREADEREASRQRAIAEARSRPITPAPLPRPVRRRGVDTHG